jgi:hypothetical protein
LTFFQFVKTESGGKESLRVNVKVEYTVQGSIPKGEIAHQRSDVFFESGLASAYSSYTNSDGGTEKSKSQGRCSS